ncbi:L-aspartate oxidase [Prolixibacter denitrificans]|uniref:L-aspartate oxidase n=1 Tax=Prolixibacter denitrificans TaxID=1541063 RepID=A0A2P8CII6_9BACT|nr:L-aspartate oxidase [Prolixibacter denitrificans]PSK84785.1 L-aspartate oxidase [Prolixibacter denitrificans]GET20950.1 L-aspartate oxidase [Prolixibacter denitrificans]
MKTLEFDFVIIGSGLAGLISAYHAANHGTVALISKSELDVSNSYHAQGGIAVAIDKDDRPENHFQDTLTAGRGLCDHDAVDILVREGQQCIQEIISCGMEFDHDESGELFLGLEGGHTHRRILHAGGDATGKMMTSFMLKKVLEKKNISTFEYTAAVRILVDENRCHGVQTLQFINGENILFKGKATVMATGGLSRLYTRSTNPHTATGDGIALAWRAGVKVADMEFIQFHPSALSLPGEDAFLVSEAVRGEGARLLDVNGERFMEGIHPLAELAPRDVVAAAIFRQMKKTDSSYVYLSLKHLDAEYIRNRFHSIDAHLTKLGIDMTRDLIPVAPAAHYMVGGIRTDLWGQTSLSGLYACGEVASTGVMGANRLASNSLLECLVYGKRAIEKARRNLQEIKTTEDPAPIFLNKETDQEFLSVKNELADLMNSHVGILRNHEGLKSALEEVNQLSSKYDSPSNDYNHHKIKNLTDICRLIIQSAILRKESRGGHIREDHPEEVAEQAKHIIQQLGKDIQYEPVRIKK